MRNIFIVLPLLLLSACTLHASFTPENGKLNDATVGVPYYDKINIFGGNVASLKDYYGNVKPVADITPVDSGLYIQHCNDNLYDNNCLQIRGTPTKSGVVKVQVSGIFNIATFQKSSEFDKTYTIIIKKPDGSS